MLRNVCKFYYYFIDIMINEVSHLFILMYSLYLFLSCVEILCHMVEGKIIICAR